MFEIETFTGFQDAYVEVLREVHERPHFVNAPRGNAARERLNVSFALEDPRDRMLYLPTRRANIVFCYAEALWYLWGRDDLNMISYYAPSLAAFSADGKTLTGSAYGPRLFKPVSGGPERETTLGRSQWHRILNLLAEDPASKRAVAAFFQPGEVLGESNPDVSCTLALQFLLRDGRLHMACYMRGNDAVIGLVCDVFSFTLIQEFTAHQLGVGLGSYAHHVGSMHINDTAAARAAAIIGSARRPYIRFPVRTMPPTRWADLKIVEQYEGALRRDEENLDPGDLSWLGLDPYWQQVMLLMDAYRQIVHYPGSPIMPSTLEALDEAFKGAHEGAARLQIGFSFWGFLGDGITDTPDGGRFWRRAIVDAVEAAGHQVILLQADRDAAEAGQALPYRWDAGFPDLDVLLAEWRWPLHGRNTTECGTDGHTCDLHRQDDLIGRYTSHGTATIIWDTDRQLHPDDPLRLLPNVIVGDPALLPSSGAFSMLAPVSDALLDGADPDRLAARTRPLALTYVGNQYDRDDDFDEFFASAATRFPHRVAGKWTNTGRWPHVNFTGRCPFPEVQTIYRDAVTTVLLNPARYAKAGAVSQRRFESVLSGCLPLAPGHLACAEAFAPEVLHVADRYEVIERIDWARRITGTREHSAVISDCLARLEPFRLSSWIGDLIQRMQELVSVSIAAPRTDTGQARS
jgi:thymidylate synthase